LTEPRRACRRLGDRHHRDSDAEDCAQEVLPGLPAPQQRDVVILRVGLGLSARDTAGVLGIASAGAVRVSRHRALAVLRRHIAAAPVP
jgi:DNA-directed RNA polymerase specialized sigma24 family protein